NLYLIPLLDSLEHIVFEVTEDTIPVADSVIMSGVYQILIFDTPHGKVINMNLNFIDSLVCDTISAPYQELGVGDNKNELKVYPNPASNYINISLLHSQIIEEINLINMQGALVIKKKYKNQETTRDTSLDIAGVSDGIYFVQVKTEGSVFYSNVIIKKLE